MSTVHSGDSATIDESSANIEWIIRPFKDNDVPGLVALANTVFKSYKVPKSITEESFRTRLGGPRSDPERQYVVVEGPVLQGIPAGMPVAYGAVRYDDDDEAGERMFYLRITMHPAAEGLGLERVLASRLLEIVRGYQADSTMKPLPKASVRAWSFEQVHHLRTLWAELGLREVRQFWTMARPLNEPIDEPAAVEGATIRTFNRPGDDEGARIAFDASFADHWDHHPTSSEDWLHWLSQPQLRPDLSLLAEVDATPGTFAGFCIIEIFESDNKQRDVCEGWVELLGTIRGWRRMGLGRSILLHGLHSLRSAGMDTALLGVDSESPTGANRLYESVGFRIRSRDFSYACNLDEVRI
ncbi:MAG: GNAT family N-acetyltransferase [Chloroflexota bacterium]